jgi:hypothetical protein
MVASVDTVMNVLKIVKEHVSEDAMRKIVEELEHVDGNRSFRETVARMKDLLPKVVEK